MSGLKPSDYVHLHNHTQYSLLDGLTKIPQLIDYVKESGMEAVAQTDHGTLSGAIEFYKAAQAAGIKPIIGIETYVASRKMEDKEPGKDKVYYHLILLAMNNTGYQNLMRISTEANLNGMYYKPRIDHDLLEKYNEGIIVLSGCIGGEVADSFRQQQNEKAYEIAKWYKKIFGDRYYIEVQDHGHADHPSKWDEQEKVNIELLSLAKELAIPPVVTCDAHYLRHEDQEAHEILLCVQTGSFLSDEKRMSLKDFELHVTDPKELIKRWEKLCPEAITNTKAIADRCKVTIELGNILIPKFPVPKGETEKTYLDKLVFQGLAEHYGGMPRDKAQLLATDKARKTLPPEILERANYELGVVERMGFNGYFLIVQDLINWGKSQGIVFGPGRGSAAGSVMSYGLHITTLDPLKYDLVFERFLNPDRVSMPDIDIDIQDTRRNEVIQYCADKYGHDHVANIVTFGRMAARNAVRDVARVLQVPYAEADRLAKMIPPPAQGRHIPLATSIKETLELKHEYENSDTAKRVFDLAIQLEGTIRSHGVHAAGVVIAPDEIVKYIPLEMAQKGVVATQYSMGPVDELGLLKIDFLGLANLSIIKNALRIIKKVYNVDIDLATLPLDDPKVYELLGNGDTTGVFQFESAGMKRYLRELKPTVFDDIIAMGALYRPGPMQFIDSYIARKHGHEKTAYLHPKMEDALRATYGILVYQEQVMQIARELCGFTGGQADTLRKGVAKKKPEVLAALKKDFIAGALENSDITKAKIEEFWKSLEAFAAYCFPKAHAACYGTTSYWTAYLKAYYPSAFMAALMTSDFDDTDRLAIEMSECQKMGVTVLPPDVNESFHEFAVVKTRSGSDSTRADIRFGLDAVKNVGHGAADEIIRARQQDGDFNSLEDFLSRVNVRVVNRKAMESLIKSGAFDRFGDRSDLMHNMDVILAYGVRLQKEAASGQTDIFGNLLGAEVVAKPKLIIEKATTVYTPRDMLLWERELLGLYLSQHPLAMYKTYLEEQTMPINELKPELDGKQVIIGGAISTIREITTKNGAKMAFVGIEDTLGSIELILFPNALQQTLGLWERDRVVLVRGKLSAKDREGNIGEEIKVIVDDAREITAEQATSYQPTDKKLRLPAVRKTSAKPANKPDSTVYIRLANSGDQDLLLSLKQAIDEYPGTTPVVLVLGQGDEKQIIKLPTAIANTKKSLDTLSSLAGPDNVKVQNYFSAL